MIRLKITKKKDGREVAWYRDSLGRRVGTSMRATTGQMKWSTARQMMELGQYWIELRRERVSKGIGSDGAPMPPLKQPGRKTRYSISRGKIVEYGNQDTGYPAFKRRLGLPAIRDLYGPGGQVKTETESGKKRYLRSGTKLSRALAPGGKGHMLDDVRVNYVDDTRCTIDISTTASRTKARANEARASWWGSPASEMRKLAERAARVFGMSVADRLLAMGLIGATALAQSGRWLNPVRRIARRAA